MRWLPQYFPSQHAHGAWAGTHRHYDTETLRASRLNPAKLKWITDGLSKTILIAEQAGGYASNGAKRILDILPDELHQRTPLFVGNKEEVLKLEEFINRRDE